MGKEREREFVWKERQGVGREKKRKAKISNRRFVTFVRQKRGGRLVDHMGGQWIIGQYGHNGHNG